MGALSELLEDPARRRSIVDDGVKVIDAEVASKSGFSGVAVKGAYKVVKNFKPGFVARALDMLMPEFAAQVDPFYERWRQGGQGSLESYFVAHGGEIAEALLSITDKRATTSPHRTVRKTYGKLRPQGVQHTVAAMPRLAGLVERHVN